MNNEPLNIEQFKKVSFFTDGKLVELETDVKTARAIGMYKDVYNKIQNFDISSRIIPGKHDGFVREAIVAQSRKLKIVCTKEYLPNVPEALNAARYECGILNTKTNKFEPVGGGVPQLYYKLFHGRSR